MNAAEVVVREVQRHGCGVVLDFLGETIGQACEAPNPHSHGEILALHVGRADMFRVGVSHNPMTLAGRADRRIE